VFQINAVQPVRYVIEEVSGLFDVENEVRIGSLNVYTVAGFLARFCYVASRSCDMYCQAHVTQVCVQLHNHHPFVSSLTH